MYVKKPISSSWPVRDMRNQSNVFFSLEGKSSSVPMNFSSFNINNHYSIKLLPNLLSLFGQLSSLQYMNLGECINDIKLFLVYFSLIKYS